MKKTKQEKVVKIPPTAGVILVVLLIAVFAITSGIFKSGKYNNQAPNQYSTTASIIPSPSFSPQPSEKALKIASFMVVRATEKEKAEAKQKRGDEKMPDTELIRRIAFSYDSDPALMAKAEAGMQQIIARENRPTYNEQSNVDASKIENKLNEIEQQQRQIENDFKFNCLTSGGTPSGNRCL